ncbi:MAG: Gfo/Idh/MocA family oxidoreductase [Candidatus Latescibacteria bacterium]|nr:Gfo/Idh/MocA family oxidoreductase [Candidatus Latescibacterota bacterium]
MQVVGIIGSGYWGKNLVRTFNALNTVNLKYVADVSADSLELISRNYPDIQTTEEYRAILDDDDVTAVVIGAPAVLHYEIAREAINAGKHVFVEKPFTLDVGHARELVALADEKNLKLMVGHLLLYHPCITAIKEQIQKGEIGDLYYLYSQRLNLGKVRKDENALLSFAPHDISVALHLMGNSPVSVSACGKCYLQKDIEDVVFLTMNFPDNKIAHVHVSWLDPHKIRRTTVVGSQKMIVFDDMEPREKIRVYDKGIEKATEYGSYGEFLSLRDGNIFIPAVKMAEPLMIECKHFIDCIENDRVPVSDGRNGLIVTQVLDAGQKSLKSGGNPIMID